MHLLALTPKCRWYQQRPEDGPGEDARERELERECERLGRPVESCSEEMSWRSSLISDWSWATSELAGGGGGGVRRVAGETRDDTVGGATSNILSARVSRETVSPEEASTMRTWLESRWKHSSRRRELSGWGPAESPRSCCICHRSWVGFRLPSSFEVKRSSRRILSEAAVRLIRRSLSFEYASTSGRLRMMSQTSVANSLDSAAMTWSNCVLWLVMLRVANCASTCANQTKGSAGQKGGILTETAATEAGTGDGACSSSGWTAGASDIVRSLVGRQLGQSKQDSEGRQGHQYNDRRRRATLPIICLSLTDAKTTYVG